VNGMEDEEDGGWRRGEDGGRGGGCTRRRKVKIPGRPIFSVASFGNATGGKGKAPSNT
jgi:hypothetical protein